MVWNILSEKYLGRGFNNLDSKLERETWELFYDSRLTDVEQVVLGSTYDYVLIKKEYIKDLITAYREFSKLDERLSLDEQSDILEMLEKDDDCIAVGFHQNSVSCYMWENYNCLTGTEHWYLFDAFVKDNEKGMMR